ncbi:NAD-dependent epimerase/dehydratase family protein [candidate division KSB1 bacterium]|nr:NAD-dependent epimerase/dehydratase family protein [candidate division KSB1 bacterium]
MIKNVLVTGGYGFLGLYVVKSLLDAWPDVNVKIVDIRRPESLLFDMDSNPRTTACLIDINHENEIRAAFAGIDVVIHLAGFVSSSIKAKDRMFRINVHGTENVLEAMLLNHVPRLIHISSVAALGYRSGDEPINEDFHFDWRIARRRKKYYMLTKHLADVKVADYRHKGIDSVILHPSLMYGPGDTANSSRLIRAIKAGKIPFNMPGGTSVIHVQDVANGILAALKSGVKNEHFLLTGYNYTFAEINKIIADQLGVSPPRRTMPRSLHPVLFRLTQVAEMLSPTPLQLCADDIDNAFRCRYYDNSKARQWLGWRPTITFAQTIIETKKWMEENGHFDE